MKPVPAMLEPGERILLTPAAQKAAQARAREREKERRRQLPLTQQTAGDRPLLFVAMLLWPFVVAILYRVLS